MTQTHPPGTAMAVLYGYPFELRPLTKAEGGGYIIRFPDLPGCISDGETIEETMVNAQEALEGWLETRNELKQPISAPTGVGELGKLVARLPRSLHLKLLSRAKQEGVSVNTLVVAWLSETLARK